MASGRGNREGHRRGHQQKGRGDIGGAGSHRGAARQSSNPYRATRRRRPRWIDQLRGGLEDVMGDEALSDDRRREAQRALRNLDEGRAWRRCACWRVPRRRGRRLGARARSARRAWSVAMARGRHAGAEASQLTVPHPCASATPSGPDVTRCPSVSTIPASPQRDHRQRPGAATRPSRRFRIHSASEPRRR